MGDIWLCRLIAPCHTTEPTDQGIEMAVFHGVDAAEIGNDPVSRLSCRVAIGLNDLQVAPLTASIDAHEHDYRIRLSPELNNTKNYSCV